MRRDIESIIAGWIEKRPYSLYDRLDVEGEVALPCVLFAVPIGAADPYRANRAKTQLETNMVRSCQLPPPRNFILRRIVFSFSKATDYRDLWRIAEESHWYFQRDDKHYFGGTLASLQTIRSVAAPLRICEFCRSVYVQQERCPGCGASQFRLSSIGEVDTSTQFLLDLEGSEMLLAPLQCFAVKLEPRYGLKVAQVGLWCHLEGIVDWAVW